MVCGKGILGKEFYVRSSWIRLNGFILMVSTVWKRSLDRELVEHECSGKGEREEQGEPRHPYSFVSGVSRVFNFSLAFCSESFSEAILES